MAQRHYSFPVVTGIDARDSLASRKARMTVYQHLLAELDSNGQMLSQQISEIDLTDPADAHVLMPEQGGDILAHFGEDRFLERYQRYKTHIAEWRKQYPKLVAVDLRYEQQAVLEMAAGTNVAQAAADEQAAATTTDDVKPSDAQAEAKPVVKQKAPANQKAAAKPAQAVHALAGKPTVKPVGKVSSKAKARTIKIKAQEKKRVEAKRAASSVNRQKKIAPTSRLAASAGEGQ
jgi:cell division protein FtsQ